MKLVIVESPAKAKTINKYLGDDFHVIASFGHVRDIPSKNGSVLPEQDFEIKYDIPDKSTKYVNEILKYAAKADNIYLATDPDREGESISWHIVNLIKEKHQKRSINFQRIAFNEITKKAVLKAIENPRNIDIDLVNAQQARRALDYLVGFHLSPLLWRKLPGCRSAGRVQSVALRLICERENEIEKFQSQEYWDIILGMETQDAQKFTAKLTHINNEKLEKFSIINESQAHNTVQSLKTAQFIVQEIEKKQQKRNPASPFITSSLQQEAARKLGFSAKKTMQVAQKLYEGIEIDGENIGLITYMRTDGVNLATDAIKDIRELIKTLYGNNYLPSEQRVYKSKAKNAQEAHEAIRPTNINLLPNTLKDKLNADYFNLYDLIWKRTVACQMESVVLNIVSVYLSSKDQQFIAKANGSVLAFDGFYKVYKEDVDDDQSEDEKMLPNLSKMEEVTNESIKPTQHFTEPPARYSEASLVKKLEELGIGRPSTYASILSVLQEREYVKLDKKRFVPEELGRLLTVFLVGFFKKYVEYDFTASLETDLDIIAAGKLSWKDLLKEFWQGFSDNINLIMKQNIVDIIAYIENSLEAHLFGPTNNRHCPSCKDGSINLRLGRYGAFLACNKYPDCDYKKAIINHSTDQQDLGDNGEIANKLIGKDNSTGADIYLKKGPYGWYLELNITSNNTIIEEKKTKKTKSNKTLKPKRVQVPNAISPDNINLETALKLLALPLNIGINPDTNSDITLGIGRFGPYLKHNNQFTSVPKKYNFLNISITEAIEILRAAEEKKNKKK